MRILPLRNDPAMALTVAYGPVRHVVVSDEAIITVERRSAEEARHASIAMLLMGGGMMGALLAALVDQLGLPGGPTRLYLRPRATPGLAEMTEVLTCWASEVPPELLNEHRWPRVEGFRPVTFYPRSVIESLVVTPWQLRPPGTSRCRWRRGPIARCGPISPGPGTWSRPATLIADR